MTTPQPRQSRWPAGAMIDDDLLDRHVVPSGPGLYQLRKDVKVNRALHFPFGAQEFTRWIYPWAEERNNPQYSVLLVDARPFPLRWSVGAVEYKVLYNEKLCGMVQIIPQMSMTGDYDRDGYGSSEPSFHNPFLVFFEKIGK